MTRVPVSLIGEVAGTSRCDSSFHRRIGFVTTLDAIKEILQVRDGAVTKTVRLENWIVFAGYALVINAEAASIDFQRSIRASELQPSVVDRRSHHALIDDIEPWIAQRCLHGVGTIPLFKNILVPQHLHVPCLVAFHRPVRYVDPVRK